MSRQMKKKEINKYKIKINKLQNKIYELEYLFQIKSNACDELLQDNKQLKKDLEFEKALVGVYKDGKNKIDKAIEIYKEKIRVLERDLELSKLNNETWWKNYNILSREKNIIISDRDKLKSEVEDKNTIIAHLMSLKEQYRVDNRNLRAENYNLKNRGFFQRVLNRE